MKNDFVIYYDRFDHEAGLPIFKKVSELSKEIILRLSKIENTYKPIFSPQIMTQIEILFKTVILANKVRGNERKELLEEFLNTIFTLKINLRIMSRRASKSFKDMMIIGFYAFSRGFILDQKLTKII